LLCRPARGVAARFAAHPRPEHRERGGRSGGRICRRLRRDPRGRGRPGARGARSLLDARDAAARQKLLAALEPIRVSGYDERPYKNLSTAPQTAATERRSVYVISHVDVAPDPRVAPMLVRLAEAARKEPGNLRFDVVQHTMRANHFTVIEHWRDHQALDAHVAAQATRQYRDELQPLTGSPLDERVYEAIE
jgi:quinol monooxygenase YgiN